MKEGGRLLPWQYMDSFLLPSLALPSPPLGFLPTHSSNSDNPHSWGKIQRPYHWHEKSVMMLTNSYFQIYEWQLLGTITVTRTLWLRQRIIVLVQTRILSFLTKIIQKEIQQILANAIFILCWKTKESGEMEFHTTLRSLKLIDYRDQEKPSNV